MVQKLQFLLRACLLAAFVFAVWECDVAMAKSLAQDEMNVNNLKPQESIAKIDLYKRKYDETLLEDDYPVLAHRIPKRHRTNRKRGGKRTRTIPPDPDNQK